VSEFAAAVLRPGDVLAMEEPGYQRAVAALRAAGVEVLGVPVNEQGVVVEAIPRHVRAVYCSPAHQYPLGGKMSAARRVELVERARQHGWLLVEDDYDGELRYDVAPLPLLAALAPDVVVHLGTTSKIFTSTLGAGWMVAPGAVINAVIAYRERTGIAPAVAGQRVLVELANNGDLARHLRRVRRELSERRELVRSTLASNGHQVLGDDAGAHVVLLLPDLATERWVLARAQRSGIRLDGLQRHFVARQTWYGIAIGYTACTREQLDYALVELLRILGAAGAAATRAGTPRGPRGIPAPTDR
ncbi:MAG: PLP-dependent aminotransferase family protein, partial [Sciscionella sp.]